MKNLYKATIIIPTYNNCKLLNYTLNSIVKQNLNLQDIEVIVVDDGSSDDTVKVINNYNKLLKLKYFFQEDRGNRVSRARNIGIQNAEADIVIFIDSGILIGNDFVTEHLKQHQLNGPACAVIGYVYGFDQYDKKLEENISLIDINNPAHSIKYFHDNQLFRDMRHKYYSKYKFEINSLPAPWAFFLTCNVSMNKFYLNKTGLFDEIFDQRWGVEDLDMGYRLHMNNIRFIVAQQAAALHYPHDSNMDEKFKEEVFNKYQFHQKYNSISTKAFLETSFIELNEKLSVNLNISTGKNPSEKITDKSYKN